MIGFDLQDFETNLGQNTVIFKKIDIDEKIFCFIMIDGENKKILNPILNKIVDYILNNINSKDTYNKFSITLENINHFLKTIKNNENNLENINIFVGILEKRSLYFSRIGDISCNLITNKKEFLEISDRVNKSNLFDYISSGEISNNENVIITNINILDNLNTGDIDDIVSLQELSEINENIIKILKQEKISKNIKIFSFIYEGKTNAKTNTKTSSILNKISHLFYKSLDNNFSKKIIALYLILKEKISSSGKIIKNIVFLSGIIISTFLLYIIISSLISTTTNTSKNITYKSNLIEAREYLRIAKQNLANPEVFDLNIKKAEDLVLIVKENNLFLNDINAINDDISIIKKQFNGVETFESNTSNLLFSGNFGDGIKLLEINKKFYVLTRSSIYGPILIGQEIQNNIFNDLEIDDEFLDATVVGDNIIIVTKKNRVVNFLKNGNFKYVNVIGQDAWQGSYLIENYNNNIYLTNKEGNQIFKHSNSLGNYTAGIPYLNNADSKNITKILSIGIDGGIYILKNDLTLLKFFSAPKYRLESIVLNKLPKNYTIENSSEPIKIISRSNLNYIYMYLNNKIWVFEPNTKVFTDTKSLTYIGQIEGKNEAIKGFYVIMDNEINVLTQKGIYKMNFDIKDGKLILR